jgi:uncharacterized protein YijF (DUF1287 family)
MLAHSDREPPRHPAAGALSEYPKDWGRRAPDRSIDHRRVKNLETYFRREGWAREVTQLAADLRPGDLVTCIVPPNLPHIMIVSDRVGPSGAPLVLHNIGRGAQEEDRLFEFKFTGRFRLPERAAPQR